MADDCEVTPPQKDFLESIRRRYPGIHPLLFARSIERSRSRGELFDILETLPTTFPIVWDEERRRWVTTDDSLQCKQYEEAEDDPAA